MSVAATFVLGYEALSLLFGADFELSGRDLALLSASTSAIMVALVLVHALVALQRHRDVALSWLSGVLTFVLVTAAGHGPVLRVELGLLAGAVAAACAAAGILQKGLGVKLEGDLVTDPIPLVSD